jgi:hypothetical protein
MTKSQARAGLGGGFGGGFGGGEGGFSRDSTDMVSGLPMTALYKTGWSFRRTVSANMADPRFSWASNIDAEIAGPPSLLSRVAFMLAMTDA